MPSGPICTACEDGDHGQDFMVDVMKCLCPCHTPVALPTEEPYKYECGQTRRKMEAEELGKR